VDIGGYMSQRKLFIGFSTQEMEGKRGWSVTDIQLIKRDLLNHFYTRKGERVMLPEFGTIIWDMLFEPFTSSVKATIVADVRRIVASDPRVSLESLNVNTTENGITVAIELRYTPFDSVGTFSLSFDRRSLERA
jgi:phage baseplate assembly protein W